MVASNLPRTSTNQVPLAGRPSPSRTRPGFRSDASRRTLALIQGSLSGRSVSRNSPLLAVLHRATDGTLAGLGLCLLALGGLTLHWQNRWGESYQQLESAQVLEHRLQESSAQLEQHYLAAVRRPGWLVPTSSEKLIYLPTPKPTEPNNQGRFRLNLQLGLVPGGY